jgi:hypothetical protein
MISRRSEVLVIILLIGVAVPLLTPVLGHMKLQAARAETMYRIKKLALGLHDCNDKYKYLPPACDVFGQIKYAAPLHVHLLPFIEQHALYETFLQPGKGKADAPVAGFHAPEDVGLGTGEGVQSFAANLRVFSFKGYQSLSYSHMPPLAAVEPGKPNLSGYFIDGTSNTIVFATKLATCQQQLPMAGLGIDGGSHYAVDPTSPFAAFFGENIAETPAHPSDPDATFQLAPGPSQCLVWPLMGQSFGSAGITVAMADGSVHTVSRNVSAKTWNEAVQPNDSYGCGGCDW